MSHTTATFADLCRAGKAQISQVDDYIEAWLFQPGASKPLHAFLGLTEDEYRQFVTKPNALDAILAPASL